MGLCKCSSRQTRQNLKSRQSIKPSCIKKTGFLTSLGLALCQCTQNRGVSLLVVLGPSFSLSFLITTVLEDPGAIGTQQESDQPQRLWEQITAGSECVNQPFVIVVYQSHSCSFYPNHMWSHFLHNILVLESLLQNPMLRYSLHLQKNVVERCNDNHRTLSPCMDIAYEA